MPNEQHLSVLRIRGPTSPLGYSILILIRSKLIESFTLFSNSEKRTLLISNSDKLITLIFINLLCYKLKKKKSSFIILVRVMKFIIFFLILFLIFLSLNYIFLLKIL